MSRVPEAFAFDDLPPNRIEPVAPSSSGSRHHRSLDRSEAAITLLPLFKGLELDRLSADVGNIQLSEYGCCGC